MSGSENVFVMSGSDNDTDSDRENATPSGNGSWKRKKTWLKNVKKKLRNSAEVKTEPHIACSHGITAICEAGHLTLEDILNFRQLIYEGHEDYSSQNAFVMQYMNAYSPVQKRPRKTEPKHRLSCSYRVRKIDKTDIIVCQKTFCSVTGLGPKRVNLIARQLYHDGGVQKERRGGSRFTASQREIRLSIISHIQSLHVIPSHYSREKSSKQYLPHHLCIPKLWRAWKEKRKRYHCATASLSTYKKVFYTNFNLSFRTPRTDVCSTCVDMQNKIRALKREGKKDEYHKLRVELKVHRARAKRFYQLMKSCKDQCDVLCVTFDLQKNLALPKINITEAYYCRQLWLYNLGIVVHDVHQTPKNVFFYTWLESESGRGSNEIVSALFDFLRQIRRRVMKRKYRTLALFSDSCAGQNKNGTMIAFLLRYMSSKMNLFQKVSFTFPIRGHSYMPPDRVFGRVEKEIRKEELISSPEGYYEILRRHGRVYKLGEKWNVYDYKSLADTYLKSVKNLDMRKNRVWTIKKKSSQVAVSNAYAGQPTVHDLLRVPVTTLCRQEPVQLPPTTHVPEAKRTDVEKLLSFVDLTPTEYTFYKKHLDSVCTNISKKGIVERPIAKNIDVKLPKLKQPTNDESIDQRPIVKDVEVDTPKRGRPRKPKSTAKLPIIRDGETNKPKRGRPRKVKK